MPPGRKENPIVFLTIQIGGTDIGRIIIELRADVVPKTAENFRMLCTGESKRPFNEQRRWFKGCIFHRVVQDCHCQSGDFINGDGSSGRSAFQTESFPDENFILKHVGPGVLSMVNSGPDTNTSQFYISFAATRWLDNEHVVFGCALGMDSMTVINQIHEVSAESGHAYEEVKISDCGQLFP